MTLSTKAWRRPALTIALAGLALSMIVVSMGFRTASSVSSYPNCLTSQLEIWWGMPGEGVAGGVYYDLQFS